MMSDNIIQDKPIHIPVLKDEVISLLDIQPDGIYIDGTCGLGGHSKLILKNLSPKGTLIGIDVDQAALDLCEASVNKSYKNFHIKKNSYSNLPAILKKKGIDRVSGILLDLGLSSLQLDSLDRGFSYKNNCQLDMRFDQSTPIKAADLINKSMIEGVFIARSANKGISAFIDPSGRVLKSLNTGESGSIELNFPNFYQSTFFSIYGNKIFFLILFLYIFLALIFKKLKI